MDSAKQALKAGQEAEAKRAKKEGQEDAAAAKVCQGWAVSPAELREALCSASASIDLSDMHDAAEVNTPPPPFPSKYRLRPPASSSANQYARLSPLFLRLWIKQRRWVREVGI